MRLSFFLFSSIFLLIYSCRKSAESGRADFDIIQDEILTPTCATSGCHRSSSDATFAQHGLILAAGQSYDQLVNQLPQNPAARASNYKLVTRGDAELSFLYHKITCTPSHHPVNGNFGSQMPLGGQVLSKGQIEFIRRWINAGASRTSTSVDDNVLRDSSACQVSVQPLDPPPAGAGFQMTIDPFEIPKNFEREVFIRKNTPNTSTVYVNRLQMRGASNSHHFVLYGFRNQNLLPPLNQLRDLRDPVTGVLNQTTLQQMQNHIFLGGGTDVNTDVTLPAGVAIKLQPGTPVDLNAHYFNRTNFTLTGQNFLNLYTVPASSVQYEAKTLDLNNLDINIPPLSRRTFTKTFTFNTVTRVVMLTSHFHKLGETFIIKIAGGPRNGEIVYTNTDWEHPLVKMFPTPIVLQPGEGLTSEVTYYNPSNVGVGFGLTSQDEMNIIFGYYY